MAGDAVKARALVILCPALVAVSLWVAAAPMAERIFGHGDASASSPGGLAPTAKPAFVDSGPVLDFAPFGQAVGAAPAGTLGAAQTGLVLLGITIAQPQSGSRAKIFGGEMAAANYRISSAITADFSLIGVFVDHVSDAFGGQELDLNFDHDDAGADPLARTAGLDIQEGRTRDARTAIVCRA